MLLWRADAEKHTEAEHLDCGLIGWLIDFEY